MFQELPAYSQETLHKPHLVYCVRIMSVGFIILIYYDARSAKHKTKSNVLLAGLLDKILPLTRVLCLFSN
jgi:hypothetical protein